MKKETEKLLHTESNLAGAKQRCESLTARVEGLEDENGRLKEIISGLEKEVDRLKEAISGACGDSENWQRECEKAKVSWCVFYHLIYISRIITSVYRTCIYYLFNIIRMEWNTILTNMIAFGKINSLKIIENKFTYIKCNCPIILSWPIWIFKNAL